MIQAFAAIFSLHDAGANATPAVRTDSNIEWLLRSSFLHLVDGLDDIVVLNFTDDFVGIILIAISELLSLVWVIALKHGAIAFEVPVMIGHPAALAAPAAPVIVIVTSSLRMSKCAVNTLLLGDTDGC